MMFSVRKNRAFLCGGFGWTIHVECTASQLDAAGEPRGVDFGEFWQWITDHITAVAGAKGTELLEPQQGGRLQSEGIGAVLDTDPASLTASRMAALLLDAFRALSDEVESVTVVRSELASHPNDSVECTARPDERAPITTHAVLDLIRRLAQLNSLRLNGLPGVDS